MSKNTMTAGAAKGAENEGPSHGLATVNEVHLIGRLSAPAQDRELPSGDVLTSFRIVVERIELGPSSRRRVDALECHTWSGRIRRQAQSWTMGDVVELHGALRRRFFRTPGGTRSMTEVAVHRARIVRRAPIG